VSEQTPHTLVDRAAHEAIDAVERVLGEAGAEIDHIIIAIKATDLPAGEKDGTVSGAGFEDGHELFGGLLGYLQGMAKSLGIPLAIGQVPDARGQG
jgi:hypothetical protein